MRENPHARESESENGNFFRREFKLQIDVTTTKEKVHKISYVNSRAFLKQKSNPTITKQEKVESFFFVLFSCSLIAYWNSMSTMK
jgi:hypothetical protein